MSNFDPAGDSVGKARQALHFALHDSDGGLDAVARVGRMCVELLPIDGASISLMIGTDRRETLYASDEVVAKIEALQFSLGEGPCFEAVQTRRPVLVPHLRAATITAWPIFAAEMLDQPVGAIFAFPLISGVISLGAMDLYREKSGWLSTADVAIALHVADIVTLAVLELRSSASDAVWWTDLPTNRAQVHQATGMLITALHISAHHALARLRGYSFATGRLVDDVADDLIARRIDPLDLDQP
ncbi:GAF domain-containing protein [Nocardia sp. SYP-A9097]|uniref:GAF and ANTAR domain-containing protein n=1 Tax=Nocardia sp. SYP-A9097 TaxID=2663237 RepID=UPI00129AF25E|nr:GAF and ANTAR domain-containing protein [Nocardia sp. SYP-A9097]MRH90696.1 GAF domain-containing protein [Nocardia sp. SYP-A9097]